MERLPADILEFVDARDVADWTPTGAEAAVLGAINTRVGAAEDLAAILDFVAVRLQPIAPCDRFSLALVEQPGNRVVSHYTKTFYDETRLDTGYTEDLQDGSLVDVLESGAVRLIHDLPAYLEWRPDSVSTALLVAEGVQSSMTCPLYVERRVVGFLFRSSRNRKAYGPRDVAVHLAMAERLSQSVEKVWRIQQLTEANRAYFELLAFVTHELKAPLASMLTEAGLLKDGYVGPVEPQQRERLERMTKKGRYLLELVDDYLQLSRLEGGEMALRVQRDVDYRAAVIEPALEIVQSQVEAQQMELSVDVPEDLPSVELDPRLVKIVWVNLLSNAVKYGQERGAIRLRVAHEEGRLDSAVWNAGPGFRPEQRAALFRRFSRLDSPELMKRKGTGVGLYTAWRIVRGHGGQMDARSEPGAWAEFSFTLPQPLPSRQEGSL